MVSMLPFMFNYFSLLCISVLVLRCEFLCFYADFLVSKKYYRLLEDSTFSVPPIYNTLEMHQLEKNNAGTYSNDTNLFFSLFVFRISKKKTKKL